MESINETIDNIIREMGIDADEISLHKSYLEFTANDEPLLKELHDRLIEARPYFIDDLYVHLTSFAPTRALIPDAPTLERLKQKQIVRHSESSAIPRRKRSAGTSAC